MSDNSIVRDGARVGDTLLAFDHTALDQSVFYPADMSGLPTSTPNPATLRRKSRRSWFETTPKGFKFEIAVEKPEVSRKPSRKSETVEVLTLSHFSGAPRLDFGTLKPGQEKICTLLLRNPHEYEQSVKVEKVPEKKHFSVPCKQFVVGPEQTYPLEITWSPKEAGGCREMILMQVDGSYRVQAYVFGSVTAPPVQKKKGKRVGLLASKATRAFSVLQTTSLANINQQYSPEKNPVKQSTKFLSQKPSHTSSQASKNSNGKIQKNVTQSKGPQLQAQSKSTKHGNGIAKGRKSSEGRRKSARLSGKFLKSQEKTTPGGSAENAENIDPDLLLAEGAIGKTRKSSERKASLPKPKVKEMIPKKKMRRSNTYSNVSGQGLVVPIIQGDRVKGYKDTSLLSNVGECNLSGIQALEDSATKADHYDVQLSFLEPSERVIIQPIQNKIASLTNTLEPSFLENKRGRLETEVMNDSLEPSFLSEEKTTKSRAEVARNDVELSFLENRDTHTAVKSSIFTAIKNTEEFHESLEAENHSSGTPSFLLTEKTKSKKPRRSLRKRSGIVQVENEDKPTGVKLLRGAKRNNARSIISPDAFVKDISINIDRENELIIDDEYKPLNDTVGQSSLLEQLKSLKSFVHDKSIEIEKSGNEVDNKDCLKELERRETFVKRRTSPRFSMPGNDVNIRRGTFVTESTKLKILETQKPSEASPRRTTFTILKAPNDAKQLVESKLKNNDFVLHEEEETGLDKDDHQNKIDCATNENKIKEDTPKERLFSADSLEDDSFGKQTESPQKIFAEEKEVFTRRATLTVTKSRPSDALLEHAQRVAAAVCLFDETSENPLEEKEVFTRRATLTVTKSRPSDALLEHAQKAAAAMCLFDETSENPVKTITEEMTGDEYQTDVDDKQSKPKSCQNSTFEVPSEKSAEQGKDSSFPTTPYHLLPTSPHLDHSRRSTHVVEKPKVLDLSKVSGKQLFVKQGNTDEEVVDDLKVKQNSQVDVETVEDQMNMHYLENHQLVEYGTDKIKEENIPVSNKEEEVVEVENGANWNDGPCSNTRRRKLSARRSVDTLRRKSVEKEADIQGNRDKRSSFNENNIVRAEETEHTADDKQIDEPQIGTAQELFFIPLDNKAEPDKPAVRQTQKPDPRKFLKKRSNPVTQEDDKRSKRAKSERIDILKRTASEGSNNIQDTFIKQSVSSGSRQSIKSVGSIKDVTSRHGLKPKASAVKGLAQSKLILSKRSKSAIPKHPLPFAAKNMFYDERWMEKQERGFVNWLNFILTPEEHQGSDVKVKVDAGKLTLDVEKGRIKLAPTNEVLSFRTYSAQRKLNRLRKAACRLFQSDAVRRVIQKIEAEVESKRLLVRKDKMIHADLGAKQKVLDMLLSYNPLWLRVGLETIYGEVVPIQCNTDVYGLSRFIILRLVASPDIAEEYAHPTVPHLYRDGYAEATARHTLKRFLMLVYFLDQAKNQRLIEHNPCLFCKNADIKASKDLLLQFSREFLSGEGDITRHLGYLGYKATNSQTALDEFDFAVKSLATDLRDGLRLSRVLEIICSQTELSKSLRVPAISRLQKIHNVEVVFNTLTQQSINTGNVTVRDIVDGHREKTLSLLWMIILHYQVAMVINTDQVKEEIQILERSVKLKKKLHKLVNLESGSVSTRRDSGGPDLHTQDERLNLLMRWCRAVCALYDIKIENFTVSFSDGRALCHILHYYHPGLLPLSQIKQETTVTYVDNIENCQQNLNCSMNDSVNSSAVFGDAADPAMYEQLLANEKENFKLLSEKVKELGGVPHMLRWSDMSNTIPDEKVVVTYLMYLCARLLDIRHESRAARVIQHAWRAHRFRKMEAEYKVKGRAVVVIQCAVRKFFLRRREEQRQAAALCIQRMWRGHRARSEALKLKEERRFKEHLHAVRCLQKAVKGYLHRRRFLQMKTSMTQLQAYCRGYLLRRRLHIAAATIQRVYRGHVARRRVKLMTMAVVKIQSAVRGFLVRKCLKKQSVAACKIQQRFKAYLEMKRQQCDYLTVRKSCVTIQRSWRKYRARHQKKQIKAAVKIQASFRSYTARKKFLKLRDSVIHLQAAARGRFQRQELNRMQRSVVLIQRRFRDYMVSKQQREEFLKLRKAALFLQSQRRMIIKRKEYLRLSESAVRLQACARMLTQRRKFQRMKKSAVTLQKYFRSLRIGRVERRNFLVSKGAAITIQAAFRGHIVRQQMRKCASAAVTIQSNVRCFLARRRYLNLKEAALVCQKCYKAKILCQRERENFTKLKNATVMIQKMFRGQICRNAYKRDRNSVVKMQSMIRAYLCRRRYRKVKHAVSVLQARYRAKQLGDSCRRQYLITLGATITLQAGVRGMICRRQYRQTRRQVICLQAAVRGYLQSARYQGLKQAAVKIQRRLRETLVARHQRLEFNRMKHAAVVIQSVWRMRQTRCNYLQTTHSVIVAQSAVRRFITQRRYKKLKTAVRTVEKFYCAKVQGEGCRRHFLICKGAALTIQAAFRGHKIRKLLKEREKAAVTVQAWFKGFVRRTKFLQLKNATLCCQRRYRCLMLTRKLHSDYVKARKAVITIQATYKGYMERKQYLMKRRSAVKIQSVFRGHYQRQNYLNIQGSVVTIQRRFRETLLARQRRQDFLKMKNAAVILQSTWRMRQQYKQFKVSKHAAVLIQSSVRRYIQQKKYQRLLIAAKTVQKHYRAKQLRDCCRREFLIAKGAAMTVQAWYRGYKVRKQLRQEVRSATAIQSFYRCYSQRSKYLRLKQATLVFQRHYRAVLLGRKMKGQYKNAKQAVIRLQASVRAWKCRQEFLRLRKAVIKVQSLNRMQVERQRYLKQRNAACTIQQWFRGALLSKAARRNFLLHRGAAITIQANVKMYIIRKLYLQTITARNTTAAIKIQSCIRSFLARRRFERLKHAAVTCQRKYRAVCCGRQEKQQFDLLKKSAIILQAHQRRVQCQKNFKKYKVSAVRIQSWFRGVRVRRDFKCQKAAAIVLQTKWRAELKCRQHVMYYHKFRDAVIAVQSMYRGRIARRTVRQHRAAIKIQAFCQMLRQRKEFLRKKRASVTIQTAVRTWQAKKQLEYLRGQRRQLKAAIRIQSVVRAWQARKQVAAIKEQKRHEREQYLMKVTKAARVHMAAMLIQRSYRNHKMMKIAKERLNSILVIQRWIRSRLQRLCYLENRRRVIGLQAHIRTWLARREKAACVIQRAVRRWLGPADVRKQNRAAIKIQALWKGFHIRKNIKSKRLTMVVKRVKEATASATEEKRLGNRTSSALDFLLRYKQTIKVLDALLHLEVASRLSGICCERMVEVNAVSVLYRLVQSCNRSQPHMDIIQCTASILINLAKYEKTRPAVYEVEGSVQTLVDLMQTYRDKGLIFNKICTLLGIIALDNPCKMIILGDKKLMDRLRSIHTLTARKHKLEENQRVTRAKMNASALNATFMIRSPMKKQKIKPDWSLHKDKMTEIQNPLKAINFVLGNLGIQANVK